MSAYGDPSARADRCARFIDCLRSNAMIRSKKGQFGLFDATAEYWLRGAGIAETVQQCAAELVDTVGAAVGERVLGSVPGGFDRIELWSVGGQSLEVQPRVLAAERPQSLRVMDRGTVPR